MSSAPRVVTTMTTRGADRREHTMSRVMQRVVFTTSCDDCAPTMP